MNARHLKTGNIYRVVGASLDTTNGREDQGAMVYTDELRLYHRDLAEFAEKFELVDGDDGPRLPCDVALPPAMIISKGCTMSTLFRAMQRRKETGDGLVFSGGIERLVSKADAPIDLMTTLAQIAGSEMDAQWPDALEARA